MIGLLMLVGVAAVVLAWRGLTARAVSAHVSPRRFAYTVTDSNGLRVEGFAASKEDALNVARELAGKDPLELIDNTRGQRT